MATVLDRELAAFRTSCPAVELTVGGKAWHYRITPGKSGPAVMMIHGGGGSADSLFRFANRLGPQLRLLLPSIPATVATVEEALAGLRSISAHACFIPSHYVGFSMGGMLEQVMLRRAREGVSSLTLFHCPPPSPSFASTLEKRSVLMHLPASLLVPLVRWRLQHELRGSGLNGDELAFWADYYSNREVLSRTKGHQRIVLDYLRNYSFVPGDLDDWAGKVQIFETLTDVVIPKIERDRLRQIYPNATVLTFKSGGHLGNGITRWQEVADRIAAISR